MIYKKYIVFNEISALNLEGNQSKKKEILNSFYDIILLILKLAGKQKDNTDKNNFQRIYFEEDFSRDIFIVDDNYDDVERQRLKKLFTDFDLPAAPEYQFENKEVKGLGYACQENLLAISLSTDEKWLTTTLQIDEISIDAATNLTTHKKEVRNIATKQNLIEIVEGFSHDFYENCYKDKIYFQADNTDKKSQNFEHNLLPLHHISTCYLTCVELYEQKNGKITLHSKYYNNPTPIKKMAEIVAYLNGYKFENKISKLNNRDIYSHQDSNYFIATDTEKGDFEIHNNSGEHQGAISLDCAKKEAYKKNHNIKLK